MVKTAPACAWERYMPAVGQSVVRPDENDSVVSFAMLLEALGPGCQVATATNGLSALRLLNTFRAPRSFMDPTAGCRVAAVHGGQPRDGIASLRKLLVSQEPLMGVGEQIAHEAFGRGRQLGDGPQGLSSGR